MSTFRPIDTYIINLENRTARYRHILKEFEDRTEFKINIVKACKHENGAIGLWNSITHILNSLLNDESDYVIICEDDHEFTIEYNKELLFECIVQAQQNDADVLLGGVSWFTTMIEVSEHLFWVERFTGTQFTILFRKFFKSILEASFGDHDSADFKMCSLTENKFFMHPFISVQKDFGYSDATSKNNKEGRVNELFNASIESVFILKKVNVFYQNNKAKISLQSDSRFYNTITIPTYIINLPECRARRIHIENQFAGRNEFDITIIEAVKHNIGAVGLWLSIRKVVNVAIENDDDVIIITEDDHEFTEHYSRDFLLQNIIESNEQGADYLSGSSGSFHVAIPVTKNRFWVNPCLSTQFIIIYKKFFNKILEEPFDDEVIADKLLSEMTSNKMVLYPFISAKKDLGYSGIKGVDTFPGQFAESSRRLGTIRNAFFKYQLQKDHF